MPPRARARLITTGVGAIGVWYWQKTDGSWLWAFEGQGFRTGTGTPGLDGAFAAMKRAGREARAKFGNPVRNGSSSLRFAILERDGFACVYCGRRSPDVVLHVDHLIPVADNGGNDPDNLVTACRDCNLGKSNRPIGQAPVILRQIEPKTCPRCGHLESKHRPECMFGWGEDPEAIALCYCGDTTRQEAP